MQLGGYGFGQWAGVTGYYAHEGSRIQRVLEPVHGEAIVEAATLPTPTNNQWRYFNKYGDPPPYTVRRLGPSTFTVNGPFLSVAPLTLAEATAVAREMNGDEL